MGKKHLTLSKTDTIGLCLCTLMILSDISYYKMLYCSSCLGKSHEADFVKEALHRETRALLSRLSQIKELLSTPEVRMKIRKELFEDGHNPNNKWKVISTLDLQMNDCKLLC